MLYCKGNQNGGKMKKLIITALLGFGCGFTPKSGTYTFQALEAENTCGPAYSLTVWEEPAYQPMVVDADNDIVYLTDSTGDFWNLDGNVATQEELMYLVDGGDFEVFIKGLVRMEWDTSSEGTGEVGLSLSCLEDDCSSATEHVDADEVPCKSVILYEFSLYEE